MLNSGEGGVPTSFRTEGPHPAQGNRAAAPRFPFGGRFSPVPESLRGIYERYCEREAIRLLSMIPQDAVREFYRHAAEWSGEESGQVNDPLAVARAFARHLLPLPPYERWIPDYLANRSAYLEELSIPSAPRREEPVAVALRHFGDSWYAALLLSDSGAGWRGFIQFHRAEGALSLRTAEIFRGERVEDIRERFDTFDEGTLQAFLRSVMP